MRSRSRPIVAALLAPLLAAVALAAPARAVAQAAPRAVSLRGVVTDSVAGAPLAGATVQLVDAAAPDLPARTATSDSAGRFAFGDVVPGRYVVGFLHPVLDALGLAPISRAVVAAEGDVDVALAVPGPARLRRAYCGAESTGGAIVGAVRAAPDGAPAAGATIEAVWREVVIGAGEIAGRTARRTATAGDGGAFVLCDVPVPGAVRLVARGDAGDTDPVEVDVPDGGLARRDLVLGAAATTGDTAAPARSGPGRLRGRVVAADGGTPLADVQVRVIDAPPARTNARGEWALAGVPSGTRTLEVRAPGYMPARRAVDVVDDAPPLDVPLRRMAAVLDTLRIIAANSGNLARSGFAERRRTRPAGRFLDAAELGRLPLFETSDVLRHLPMSYNADATGGLLFRSTFGGTCVPSVFVNGMMLRGIGADELNAAVSPQRLAAVEVYLDTQVPPQFQDGLSGCGAIVVWTK